VYPDVISCAEDIVEWKGALLVTVAKYNKDDVGIKGQWKYGCFLHKFAWQKSDEWRLGNIDTLLKTY
jgi:hypothetical protein